MKFYQPVPFKEFEDVDSSRSILDCENRFQAILRDYGDIKGKTLIDLCCANGYFGFRFLQEGGEMVIGIENDPAVAQFVNALASEKKMNFICKDKIDPLDKGDLGIYLDTHYHVGTGGYLEYMKSSVDVLYTSSSQHNLAYGELCRSLFSKVESIFDEDYANRIILRCS